METLMKMHIARTPVAQGAILAGLAAAGIWSCSGTSGTGVPGASSNETGSSGSSGSPVGSSTSSSSSGESGNGSGSGNSSGSGTGSGGGSNGASTSSGVSSSGGSGSGSSSAGSGSVGSSSGSSGVSGSSGAKADAGGGSSGGSSSSGVSSSGGSGSGGQMSTTVGFASDRVIVTGVRAVTTSPATSVINLHNGGTTPVSLTALALGGTNAALFQITPAPTLPAMLAAGADLAVTVQLMTNGATLPAAPTNKDLGSTLVQATLTATLGSAMSTASVYGLVLIQANYEPTLGQVLTTLGYKLNVGMAQNNWNPNTSMNAATLPGIEAGTDEVAAPYFTKAGTGNVTMSVVARFSPVGILPYGWYPKGMNLTRNKVGTMAMPTDAQQSNGARMVFPPAVAGSLTSFDPGATAFGLWVYSDQSTNTWNEGGKPANGDYDYSEDTFNVPTATPPVHRYKSYPLKDATGAPIANSYLVAVEEAGNGDYQDYVFLLGNVTASQ